MQKLTKKELISIGFMTFSIFFGAGNLIFPPLMAQDAGTSFMTATMGFLITGIGLPLLGLVVIAMQGGHYNDFIAKRVHPKFMAITVGLLYLAIGPLFAVPRTGAVSFEIGFKPFLGIDDYATGQFIYTGIFFLLTYLLAANPQKIVDTVGKILSPLLLFCLCILFARTYFGPIDVPMDPVGDYVTAPFASGFTNGYLTMDLLASLAIGPLVTTAICQRGITDRSVICKTCIKASVVAVVLMSFVYVSLAYLGATSPGVLGYFTNGGMILSAATYYFFGDVGKIVLALIIGFACLTTSIGISSTFATYYQYVFKGNVSYKTLLKGAVLFSFLTSNIGLTELIRLTVPFLVALYPIFIVLVLLSLVDNVLGNNSAPFRWSLGLTLPFSILDGIQAAGFKLAGVHDFLITYLPLYSVNLGWFLPSLLGVFIGLVWARTHKTTEA